MRLFVCVTIAAGSLAPAPLPGQTPSAPRLYLSMFGGYRTARHLWTRTAQPFLVQTPIGPNPGQYDTLDLQHDVAPGFVIGAAGTYFPRTFDAFQYCSPSAAAGGPDDHGRGVHPLRDHVWVDEDAGADDAAHHDHGGVEEAELAANLGGVQACSLPPRR